TALALSAAITSPGVAAGWTERKLAAAAATNGALSDVPLAVRSAATDTSTPGAMRSTHAPRFENHHANRSHRSDAPTVIARGTRDGDSSHAAIHHSPAATTAVIPAPLASFR